MYLDRMPPLHIEDLKSHTAWKARQTYLPRDEIVPCSQVAEPSRQSGGGAVASCITSFCEKNEALIEGTSAALEGEALQT